MIIPDFYDYAINKIKTDSQSKVNASCHCPRSHFGSRFKCRIQFQTGKNCLQMESLSLGFAERGIVIIVVVVVVVGCRSSWLSVTFRLCRGSCPCPGLYKDITRRRRRHINESSKNNLASIRIPFMCDRFRPSSFGPGAAFRPSLVGILFFFRFLGGLYAMFTVPSCFIYVFRQREFQLIRNYFYSFPIDLRHFG